MWVKGASEAPEHAGTAPRPEGTLGSPLTRVFSPGAFEDLKKDPEPGTREFASRQLSFLPKVWARAQP